MLYPEVPEAHKPGGKILKLWYTYKVYSVYWGVKLDKIGTVHTTFILGILWEYPELDSPYLQL